MLTLEVKISKRKCFKYVKRENKTKKVDSVPYTSFRSKLLQVETHLGQTAQSLNYYTFRNI